MPVIVRRGEIKHLKDTDIKDLERLPKENARLRDQVRTQERQIADQEQENQDLKVALATERARQEGYRQGVEDTRRNFIDGINIGTTIAMEAQARLRNGGNGGFSAGQAGPLERFLGPGTQRRLTSLPTSSRHR